jgi:hypothetical protein
MSSSERSSRTRATIVLLSCLALVAGCAGSGGSTGSGGSGGGGTTQQTTPIVGASVGGALPLIGYVGVPTSYIVTISSGGTVTATLDSINLTNTNGFALTTNCPTTLTAYAYCTGTLTFTPTATGNYSTALTITDNAPNSPQTLAITATANAAPAPNVSLTPSALSFTNITPNTTSTVQTITLANGGNATLDISSIAISGANPNTFHQTNTCSAAVIAGSICTISVTMEPTASNTSYSAALVITDNAGNVTGTTQSATLTGVSGASGPVPQLVISPSSLAFTGTPVGGSVVKSVKLTNQGTGTLNLSSIAVSGSSNFVPQSSAITCGATLAAGASCNYAIDFDAGTMGDYTGALTFTDNAPGSPQTVPLTASAVEAIATFPNATVSFTNVAAKTASTPFNLELENNGNIPLTISSLTLTSATPSIFSETNNCGSSVAAGAICTISVTFTPSAASSGYAGVLTLVSNASPATQTVSVTGTSTGYTTQTALYVEPGDGYSWLYALVNGATTSIDLAASQLVDSTLLTDLTNACQRGVHVRALLTSAGTSGSIVAAYSTLNSSGANCSAAYFPFPDSEQSSLVVDNRQLAILTGTLTSSTYATARDYAWVTNGPQDIAAAEATFSLDFDGTTPSGYTPGAGSDLYWTPDPQNALVNLINGAQYSLFIESEDISSPEVVNAIIHACTNVDLEVELVVSPNYSGTSSYLINEVCQNVIYTNYNVHGTLVIVDQYNQQPVTGGVLIAPMPLDDNYLQAGRSLGAFISGSANITTLNNTVLTDVGAGIPYQ